MTAYYNENDPEAAAVLRELIKAGLIAQGEVDDRSIREVDPRDLAGFTQCHFFAGIGVWSYALRLADWPDDSPAWTGSCPCQPFSSAGKRKGTEDDRHLWPVWFDLIRECQPVVVFGEQVASKDGLGWLDLVSADLEAADYALGTTDLCAAGVGAPHIRQRLFFGAYHRRSALPGLGHHDRAGWLSRNAAAPTDRRGSSAGSDGRAGGLGHGVGAGLEGHARHGDGGGEPGRIEAKASGSAAPTGAAGPGHPGPTNGFWRDADWLLCRDGRWRPVEPGTFPLANGSPARVGLLRCYGNAIVPEVAKAFICDFRDAFHALKDTDAFLEGYGERASELEARDAD